MKPPVKVEGKTPLLLLFSAPSGGGKTTLIELLLEKNHEKMVQALTCTTREPRLKHDGSMEKDGSDYHFLEPEDFLTRLNAGNFLESAIVYGNNYGILKAELLDNLHGGKDVLLSVDVQGASSLRKAAENNPFIRQAMVQVFLTPVSGAILRQRLMNRASDKPEVIQKRLRAAKQEFLQSKAFDYLIVSTSKENDLASMEQIIAAERMRRIRSPELLLDID